MGKKLKTLSISMQFFLHYTLLFVLLFIIIVSISIISIFYLEKKVGMTDVDTENLYENIQTHGIKKAFEIEHLSQNCYIELIDSKLTVFSSCNSPHKEGYQYSQEIFNRLLITSDPDFIFHYDEKFNTILLVKAPLAKDFSIEFDKVFRFSIKLVIVSLILVLVIYAKITSISIVHPINKLLEGVKTISEGNYATRIHFKSRNELQKLRDAINEMAKKVQLEINLREKAEQNRKQLILDISHDLKTPLTNILGYAETLNAHPDLSPDLYNKYLNIIITNSIRANKLIQDLFELSQMESEAYHLELSKHDLCECMRKILISYIPELEEHQMLYEFNSPEHALLCNLNLQRFERAISNIIINSIKYSGQNTTLYIEIKKIDKTVQLIIQDDGIGIPEEIIANLFNQFVCSDSSRNSRTSGTGLGLAISRMIIEKHNGTISLDRSYQKGTRFIISLPLSQQ